MDGTELAEWQRRCGIRTQGAAARALRLSLTAYRDRLRGRLPVDDRTELLCAFHEVFLDLFVEHCLSQAEASYKLAGLLSAPLAAAAASRAQQVLGRLVRDHAKRNNGNGSHNGSRTKKAAGR